VKTNKNRTNLSTKDQVDTEQIVFVHQDGTPNGEVGPKLASHNRQTRLHLAFSCYIVRKSDGKLLITKRALHKKVWPSVWTNSFCGHVSPNETVDAALQRRAEYELGLTTLEAVKMVMPDYTYKTPPYNGIIEHEFCPIFIAYTNDTPQLNPDEVAAFAWVDVAQYEQQLLGDRANTFSWWAKDQYQHIKHYLRQAKTT
jgi:isopentenyl-diphosphate delta-isomerase